MHRRQLILAAGFAAAAASSVPAPAAVAKWPTDAPARRLLPGALPVILAATSAGQSVVAVGRSGLVVVGVEGRAFRQARTVPSRSTLTAVHFVDASHGWAVGYDGVVQHSADGGMTWSLQRQAYGSDEVLLGVWFEDLQHGIAVGLFGLVLQTTDGGDTWVRLRRLARDDADRHLYAVTRAGGAWLVAAEGGTMLRSKGRDAPWEAHGTGVKASLWALTALADSVVAVGLRGAAVRSGDAGQTWQPLDSTTRSGLTAAAFGSANLLYVGAANGALLTSRDGGQSFTTDSASDRDTISAIAIRSGRPMLFPSAAAGAMP